MKRHLRFDTIHIHGRVALRLITPPMHHRLSSQPLTDKLQWVGVYARWFATTHHTSGLTSSAVFAVAVFLPRIEFVSKIVISCCNYMYISSRQS